MLLWCAQSGIHGWGLFAKVDMAQDSMVAEYRGERLRKAVADRRERLYRAQGKDCYLFGVSDDCVIDSTLRGTISRFAVRSWHATCSRRIDSTSAETCYWKQVMGAFAICAAAVC